MSVTGKNVADLRAQTLFDLRGRVAVVTGGATGIGLMCAQTLSQNGAKVYIVGRRMEALQAAAKLYGQGLSSGGSIVPIQADVTDQSSIDTLAATLTKQESKLDFLINNASIAGPKSEIEKAEESAEALVRELKKETMDEWADVFRTNVTAPFFVAVALLPLLSKASQQDHGFSAGIVNIASISGITRTSQHHVAYNVSKAATIQLNAMMAQEFSKPGVKVRANAICPGIFPSEMTTDGSGKDQKSFIDTKDGQWGKEKGIPAGRPGKEEDMAGAVLNLCTNQYCNNAQIVIDGGYLLVNG